MKYLHTTLTTIVVAVIVLIALLAPIGTLAADGPVEATAESDPFSMVFLSDSQFFRHIAENSGNSGRPQPKPKRGDDTGLGGVEEHSHRLKGKEGDVCKTSLESQGGLLTHDHTWESESNDCEVSEGGSTSKDSRHEHPLFPESTRGGKDCFALGSVKRKNGLCDSIATNEAVVKSVAKITDLGTFPDEWDCNSDQTSEIYSRWEGQEVVLADECLLHGSGADIVEAAAVVINGDLTESSSGGLTGSGQQIGAFEEVYSDENFNQPLLLGLGNHDYGGKEDEDRDAVERMSNKLKDINEDLDKDLGGLVNHDMQGVVHLRNNALRKVRFRVIGDCPTNWKVVGVGTAEVWGRKTVRRSCQNVSVKVQKRQGQEWKDVDTLRLTEPVTNACLKVRKVSFEVIRDKDDCGTSINPGLIATEKRRSESQRNGSMSYSFDIGNYHFVQLHYKLGYEHDFSENKKNRQGFNIVDAIDWLKKDLLKAKRRGKVTVINVHALSKNLDDLLKKNGGFNVVAVFAGHLHNSLGRTGAIEVCKGAVDDSTRTCEKQDKEVLRKIPVFRSGSGFCGAMIYVDFRDDYFDWAVIRAWKEGSKGADYIRPGVKEKPNEAFVAIGEPIFIEDKTWNCHDDDNEAKKPKYGTVDFSALLDREPIGEPPLALCRDVVVDADEFCQATASIDDGSYDPEGGEVVLSQDPLGPYGPGENLVTLTVLDDDGNTASCEGVVTVVDTTPPTLSCNVPAVSPRHAPLTITATGTDNCSISDIRVDAPDCFRRNGAGRRVELKQACEWAIDEANLTLNKTMGVETQYEWEATAIDEGGNESAETCSLTIGNPKQR